jgi:hypothetical protein
MTLRPHTLPPIPEGASAALQAAFPKGNPYVDLQDLARPPHVSGS